MSRTSADGVDAALVRVGRRGAGLGARLEAFRSVAYPSALRKRLLQAADGLAIGAAGLAALSRAVGDHQVAATTDTTVPGRAVEAVAFGLLAAATALGLPGNVPAATGASRPLVLGKIVPGANYARLVLG